MKLMSLRQNYVLFCCKRNFVWKIFFGFFLCVFKIQGMIQPGSQAIPVPSTVALPPVDLLIKAREKALHDQAETVSNLSDLYLKKQECERTLTDMNKKAEIIALQLQALSDQVDTKETEIRKSEEDKKATFQSKMHLDAAHDQALFHYNETEVLLDIAQLKLDQSEDLLEQLEEHKGGEGRSSFKESTVALGKKNQKAASSATESQKEAALKSMFTAEMETMKGREKLSVEEEYVVNQVAYASYALQYDKAIETLNQIAAQAAIDDAKVDGEKGEDDHKGVDLNSAQTAMHSMAVVPFTPSATLPLHTVKALIQQKETLNGERDLLFLDIQKAQVELERVNIAIAWIEGKGEQTASAAFYLNTLVSATKALSTVVPSLEKGGSFVNEIRAPMMANNGDALKQIGVMQAYAAQEAAITQGKALVAGQDGVEASQKPDGRGTQNAPVSYADHLMTQNILVASTAAGTAPNAASLSRKDEGQVVSSHGMSVSLPIAVQSNPQNGGTEMGSGSAPLMSPYTENIGMDLSMQRGHGGADHGQATSASAGGSENQSPSITFSRGFE